MPRQCQIVTTEQKERESERKANDKTNTLAKYSTHVDKYYMYLKYIKAVKSLVSHSFSFLKPEGKSSKV